MVQSDRNKFLSQASDPTLNQNRKEQEMEGKAGGQIELVMMKTTIDIQWGSRQMLSRLTNKFLSINCRFFSSVLFSNNLVFVFEST